MSARDAGSLRRLPSGRWQARVRDPASNRMVSVGVFKAKADARRAISVATADQLRGRWVDPERGRITLTDYSAVWMKQRQIRPRTRELYEGLLRNHIRPVLGDINLGKLTSSRIRVWNADLAGDDGPGTSTAAKCYRLLRSMLATAVEDELIVKNPCIIKGAGIERPAERPVASISEVYAIADAIEARYRAIVLLATFASLRLGELRGLTRRDIDVLHRTVRVRLQVQELGGHLIAGLPKTDAGLRTVTMPASIVPDIELHLARYAEAGAGTDGLVFTGTLGQPLRRASFHAAWSRATRAVGRTDLHFHDLRHTGNTLAAATGASTKELMARMGHASPRAALIYQHATADRDAAIAAALSDLIDRSQGTVSRLQRRAGDRE